MTPFLHGFTEELVKTGSALGAVGRFALKHPVLSATALMTAGGTGMSAASAYKEGLRGGEKGTYLAASPDGPSQAAFTNYNELFDRKKTRKQVRSLSKHYKATKFQR